MSGAVRVETHSLRRLRRRPREALPDQAARVIRQRRPTSWPTQEGQRAPTQAERRAIIARGYRELAARRGLTDEDRRAELDRLDRTAQLLGEWWLFEQLDNGADRITREEFARLAGVHPGTVSGWHNPNRIPRGGPPPPRGADGLYDRDAVIEWLRQRDLAVPDTAAA